MRQKFIKNCAYEKCEDDSLNIFEPFFFTCQPRISVCGWREHNRAVRLCTQLSRSVHLHWLIALFGFKITYADKVSAFLYLRASCKRGSLMCIDTAMDRRPCFQFYWLPPAFAKITRFFFSFSMFLLWFGLILCCAPFGLGGKQNFQCLGATGLEGLAGEYEPRTIKNQPQSHLCISLFPMVSNGAV